MTLMILMTTRTFQRPKTLMTTMEPGAPAKLQPKRTMFVASVSRTNPKLQVFASYLVLLPMSMKLLLSITDFKTFQSIAVAGVPLITASPWKVPTT